jgi:alcohol dehydrogenase
MTGFDFRPEPRVVFGVGSVARLGEIARSEGFRRTLLTIDSGLASTPHVARAQKSLEAAGVDVVLFSDFGENPDTVMVERGRSLAAESRIDSLVGFGGGSSMDCAKGINLLLTNGGKVQDYWGADKAAKPLLPMIGVPTTAGTGSEAQRYALISDAETHVKMALGDVKAKFRVAILDPELTLTQPTSLTATTGYDALAHAVETYVTRRRNPISDVYAREAFRLLSTSFERVLTTPEDIDVRAAMQLGAYYSGVAIENSMLGATHACANPLTKNFGTVHGRAISMCLPSVVRFNAKFVGNRYVELAGDAEALAERLESFADAGGLPRRLRDDGVVESDLPGLAHEAAQQWTGEFNPRPFDELAALEVYRCAL